MNLLCLAVLIIVNDVCGEASTLKFGKGLPFSNTIMEDEEPIFADVEYPQSVLESVPFFYKPTGVLEPFSEDVKSNFKSIVANTKKPEQEPPPFSFEQSEFKNIKVGDNESTEGDHESVIGSKNDNSSSSQSSEEVEHNTIRALNNTNVENDATPFIAENNNQIWSGKLDNETKSNEPIALVEEIGDDNTEPIDQSNYQIEKPLLLFETEQEIREKRTVLFDSENKVDDYNEAHENVTLEQTLSKTDNITLDFEQVFLENNINNATAITTSIDQVDQQIESPFLLNKTENSKRKKRSTPTSNDTINSAENYNESEVNSEIYSSNDRKASTIGTFSSSEVVLSKPPNSSDDDDGIIIEIQDGSNEDTLVPPNFKEDIVANEVKEEDIEDL